MSFTVGQRVCRRFTKHNQWEDDRLFGEILAHNEKHNKFFVKWESNWYKPNPEEVEPANLMTEEESETLFNKLEEDFNKVADQVEAKMEKAAKLLLEANEIAELASMRLSEMDAASPLLGAMRSCGWRTSGLSC